MVGDAWFCVVKFCECCEVVCVWMFFIGEVDDGVFGKVARWGVVKLNVV